HGHPPQSPRTVGRRRNLGGDCAMPKKINPGPPIAFVLVSALVLAGAGWWIVTDTARQAADDKAAAAIVPKLPLGRLQVVHASATEVRYLALDDLKHANNSASATVLRVGRTPDGLDDKL